jgi:hypothetical protein
MTWSDTPTTSDSNIPVFWLGIKSGYYSQCSNDGD